MKDIRRCLESEGEKSILTKQQPLSWWMIRWACSMEEPGVGEQAAIVLGPIALKFNFLTDKALLML